MFVPDFKACGEKTKVRTQISHCFAIFPLSSPHEQRFLPTPFEPVFFLDIFHFELSSILHTITITTTSFRMRYTFLTHVFDSRYEMSYLLVDCTHLLVSPRKLIMNDQRERRPTAKRNDDPQKQRLARWVF